MKNYLNQNTIIEKIINIISFEIISISIIPYISAKLYIVLFDDQDKAFSGGLGALGPWGLGALGPWGLGAFSNISKKLQHTIFFNGTRGVCNFGFQPNFGIPTEQFSNRRNASSSILKLVSHPLYFVHPITHNSII